LGKKAQLKKYIPIHIQFGTFSYQNSNLGIFLRALEWNVPEYFTAIW
jgi:hypothetical protein